MWHGILEMYKRAASPSLLHKDMNLVYKAARDFITADVDTRAHRRRGRVPQDSRLLAAARAAIHRPHSILQLRPFAVRRLQDRRRAAKAHEAEDQSAVGRVDRHRIDRSADGHRRQLRQVHRRPQSRRYDLKTNIEAAQEIARQVRLRDIGGIIVVDFIDMASEASRDKVVKTMEDSLRRDRTRATIQSFSNLGLLEFTRKRIGKDLGSQLRGACPTCNGMGSVMSSQSVAIETFRQIRGTHLNGDGDVLVHVAPTVAVQMDFWYEDECNELAHSIDASDSRARRSDAASGEGAHRNGRRQRSSNASRALRVGDEHEVELLPGRLPNPTSAAAVVDGRVVEVENAANNAGNTVRIRILDVEDERDRVLAEMVTAESKPRRRRGGAPRANGRRTDTSTARTRRRCGAAIRGARADRHHDDYRRRGSARQGAERRAARRSAAARHHHRRRRGAAARRSTTATDGANAAAAVARPGARRSRGSSGAAPSRRRCKSSSNRSPTKRIVAAAGAVVDGADAEAAERPCPIATFSKCRPTAVRIPPEARHRRNRFGPSRRAPQPAPPAVAPPPPSLVAPAEEPKRAKPARRRTSDHARAPQPPNCKGTSALALPAAEKPARRPRKRATAEEPKAPEGDAEAQNARSGLRDERRRRPAPARETGATEETRDEDRTA